MQKKYRDRTQEGGAEDQQQMQHLKGAVAFTYGLMTQDSVKHL